MFFEVTAHPKPPPYVHGPCGSYGRISAKCKGEKVYIAASSVKECREYKSALLQLARRYSLPMREIHNLLLSSVLANIDTAEFDPDAPRRDPFA